jgi:hypothetical protein
VVLGGVMWWLSGVWVVVSGVWVKPHHHGQIRASGSVIYSRLSHFSAIWRLGDWAIALCSAPLSREGYADSL